MNEIEIEDHLEKLSRRHIALGGYGLSIVANPGHWTVTSAGGSPRLFARGANAAAALCDAAAQLTHLEQMAKMVAATIGIEAAQ